MYAHLDPINNSDSDDSISSFYKLLILTTGLAAMIYILANRLMLAKLVESKNRLNYEDRSARIIASFLVFITNMLHTRSGDLKITDTENKLFAIGPHRTGWEPLVVASKMEGTPPQFLATDRYNFIPGVSSFLKMFKAMPVAAEAKKMGNRSANADVVELASKALKEKGCVALFPQGNFSRIGQEPHRIYEGVAKIALKNNIPVQVIRLDGFWSLQNSTIPLFIRNSVYWRAFLSFAHMNNVRVTRCCEIDFHLKSENQNLSEKEKIEAICAQLYAYFRPTEELTVKQIRAIEADISGKTSTSDEADISNKTDNCDKTDISKKTYFLIWQNKVERDTLEKKLLNLKKDTAEMEKTASLSMNKS